MNRFEEEKFVQTFNLIFKGHELITAGMTGLAIDHYGKVEYAYNKLPDSLKQRLQCYAVDLYRQINNCRISEEDDSFLADDIRRFRFKDGTAISSLLQLVYITENLPEITWQCHVNNSKNEILDWIRYSLDEKKLANLLDGITEMKSVREIVFKHLLMSMDVNSRIEESYCSF